MFRKHRTKAVPPPQVSPQDQPPTLPEPSAPPVPKSTHNSLQFYCQLAHGSPTAFVSGFSNVRELYDRIGAAFDIAPSEILFCTLNTFKPDMRKLLGGQIGLEDFIFAHKKGRPKEVELVKTEQSLGLTITDNGAGYSFIKRIKEGSTVANIEHIKVGDHIEKLDGLDMVGKRHYEVATALKNIPVGATFVLRLIEPLSSGFGQIGPKSQKAADVKRGYGSGKETLRFKAGGGAQIEQQDDTMDFATERINSLLDSFMGINDTELAVQLWELSAQARNPAELAEMIDDSDFEAFGFSDDVIHELWGIVTDARMRQNKRPS